ncbi:MAG TPA: ABC transporter ATP-binding protein, partial [Candidatus Saccharimonadales bacterium]|nr:ABC transporter ATP-binding protein [Candidatus Saccharimonadales bacterium]
MKSFKSYISVQSFLTYLKRYKLRIAIVLLSFVLSSTLLAFIPLFLGKLVGALSANQINHHDVYVFVALLIGFSFGHSVTWRVSELLYLKLLTPISYRYENIIFRHVINQPYPYFVDKFTGKVSSNITNLSQVFREQLEELFWSYSGYLVGLVGVAIVLAVLNWQTGLLFVCGLATMFLVGRKTIRNSIKYERNLTDVQSTKNGKIIDIIANFVNVKSFQKEKAENQRVIVEQNKTIASASRAYVWSVWFWTSMNFVVRELIWPTTIVLNVYLFLNHKINLATLTALLSAILLFTNYIWSIIWNFSQLSIKFARAEEAYTYLFGKTNIVEEFFNEEELAADIYSLDDSLELQNLHFAYPDNPTHPVLSDINLKIKK